MLSSQSFSSAAIRFIFDDISGLHFFGEILFDMQGPSNELLPTEIERNNTHYKGGSGS